MTCSHPHCDREGVVVVGTRRLCEFHRGFWAGVAVRILRDISDERKAA